MSCGCTCRSEPCKESLHPGDRGPRVGDLQRSLRDLGWPIHDPDGTFGPATGAAVVAFRASAGLDDAPSVDCRVLAALKRAADCPGGSDLANPKFLVVGSVLDKHGTAISAKGITVAHVLLGTPTTLGTTTTDSLGRFKVEFPSSSLPSGVVQPNLRVQVTLTPDPDLHSKVRYRARRIERFHLVVGGTFVGRSEYQRVVDLVTPHVTAAAIAIEDLSRDHAVDLARTLGIRASRMSRLVLAHKHDAALQPYSPSPPGGDLKEPLYGLLASGAPAGLSRLRAQPRDSLVTALDSAIRRNVVGVDPADVGTIIDLLIERGHRAALDLKPSTSGDRKSLKDLLAYLGLSDAEQLAFVEALRAHRGSEEEFWATHATPFSTAVGNARLRLAVDLARLLNYFLPVVEAVDTHIWVTLAATSYSLRRVARWTQSDWEARIASSTPTTVPGWFSGTEAQYAAAIIDQLRSRFPADRLAGVDPVSIPNLGGSKFVNAIAGLPDLDLRRTPVDSAWAAANQGVLEPAYLNAPDWQDQALADFKRARRLLRIVAAPEHAEWLASRSYDSSLRILELDRDQFIEEASGSGPMTMDEAGAAYDRAVHTYHAAQALFASSAPSLWGAEPAASGGSAPASPGGSDPVFGPATSCACGHCRSIYGPSAYLFDIFVWLRSILGSGTPPVPTALSLLLDRRPELAHVELSCVNADRVLPAIDLVNEVLAVDARLRLGCAPDNAGLSLPATPDLTLLQTTLSQEELETAPEHVDGWVFEGAFFRDPAYSGPGPELGVLRDGLFPWTLPFRRTESEAELRLRELATGRDDLHRVLRARSGSFTSADTDAAYAALGTHYEPDLRWLLTGADPQGQEWRAWGFRTATPSGPWNEYLNTVQRFMDLTGLSYEGTWSLVRASFVAATPGGLPGDCDLSNARLVGSAASDLTTAIAERLRRLGRLGRATGESYDDLDDAIAILGGGNLDDACVRELADARRLAARLGIGLGECLSFFGPLRTADRTAPGGVTLPSTYARHFLSADVNTAPNPADPGLFRLSGGELADAAMALIPDPDGDGMLERLAAGCRTSVEGIRALALGPFAEQAFGAGFDPVASSTRNLANVSTLYRWSLFARTAGRAIPDLLRFAALSGFDPFATVGGRTRASVALRFLDALDEASAPGWSVVELDWLLTHRADAVQAAAATEAQIDAALLGWKGSLDALFQQALPPGEAGNVLDPGEPERAGDPTGERTRELLVSALAASDAASIPGGIDNFVHVLRQIGDGVTGAIADREGNSLDLPAQAALFDAVLQVDASSGTGVARRFHPDTATAAGVRDLLIWDPAGPDPQSDRRAWSDSAYRTGLVYFELRQWQARIASVELVKTQIADWLRVDRASAEALLSAVQVAGVPAVEYLVLGGFRTSPTSADARRLLRRLEKLARLVRDLRLSAAELSWWLQAGGDALPLSALPGEAGSPAGFPGFRALLGIVGLHDALGVPGRPMLDALSSGWTETAALLAWDDAETTTIHDALFSPASPPLLRGDDDEVAIVRVARATSYLARLQLSIAAALGLRAASVSPAAAQALSRSLRDRLDEERWRTFEKGVQDALRERTRDALAARMRLHYDLASPEDLVGHYVCDVWISACGRTSRIKSALGAAQAFAQRALLGVEAAPGGPLVISATKVKEWETWRRWYRVWEANRKVFVYPENWLEPDLRTDASPLFKQLRSELLQGDLDAERAEAAFVHYLEGLEELTHLEAAALFHEDVILSDGVRSLRLYLLARTRSEPRRYYLRERIDGDGWTPWEKVEADIASEHVLPVVFQRRLFLLWPLFEVGGPDRDRVSFRMAWSVREGGTWRPARRSTRMFPTVVPPQGETDTQGTIAGRQFRFRARAFGADLLVAVDQLSPIAGLSGEDSTMYQPRSLLRFDGGLHDWRLAESVENWSSPVPTKPLVPPGMIWVAQDFVDAWDGERPAAPDTEDPPSATALLIPIPVADPGEDEGAYLASPGDPEERAASLVPVLGHTPTAFRIVSPHSPRVFSTPEPFVFEDATRAFLFLPKTSRPQSKVRADAASTAPRTDDEFGLFAATGAYEEELLGELGSAWSPAAPDEPAPETYDALTLTTQTWPPDEPADAETAGFPPDAGTDMEFASYGSGQDALQAQMGSSAGRFRVEALHHPHVRDWLSDLRGGGVDALFARENQVPTAPSYFSSEYSPRDVARPYPKDLVDLGPTGAWSLYHWEVFFHAPLLLAEHLRRAGRYAEALQWIRRVFDPWDRGDTGSPDAPDRFWRFAWFAQADAAPIADLLVRSSVDPADLTDDERRQLDSLTAQIRDWAAHPFEPHRIARWRTSAYKRMTVMRTLGILLDWADSLFERDTIESINEAVQLYALAANVLGPRPMAVPQEPGPSTAQSWDDLQDSTVGGAFSNAIVELESLLPDIPLPEGSAGDPAPAIPWGLYFCIPWNDRLLSYWDRVSDRLFKVRHCMNIEGVVRSLPLWEPPIDPALLVAAAAAGVSIGDALSEDARGTLPRHRFPILLERAKECAREAQALGSALLSALEKQDAEAAGRLRSRHEVALLDLGREIRRQAIDEAKQNLAALEKGRLANEERRARYAKYIEDGLLEPERESQQKTKTAGELDAGAQIAETIAGILGLIPQISKDGPAWGGLHLATLLGHGVANALRSGSTILRLQATEAATNAANRRRKQDWVLQRDQAKRAAEQALAQEAAGAIRTAIAERELSNHDAQREQSRQLADYLTSKFTNEELYGWMVGRLTELHRQSYDLALDLARRAERAMRFEVMGWDAPIGSDDPRVVRLGMYDGGRKGLLAAEELLLDLRRLEVAWLDRRVRELEISKTISLADFAPEQLLELRGTGSCTLTIPELLLDRDYPGHYFRRIKSVAISIPAVTGSNAGVQCRLRLTEDRVRVSTYVPAAVPPAAGYPESSPGADDRFLYRYDAAQQIVTSHGREDTGLLDGGSGDPRYLPFEGRGAVSTWEIEIPQENNSFDLRTLADVQLHVRYTSRDGGSTLRTAASAAAAPAPDPNDATGRLRLFSVRSEFADAWASFIEPEATATGHTLEVDLLAEQFPIRLGDLTETLRVEQIIFGLVLDSAPNAGAATDLPVTVTAPNAVAIGDAGSPANDWEVPASDYWAGGGPQMKPETGPSLPLAVAILPIQRGGTTDDGLGVWTLELPSTSVDDLPAPYWSGSPARLDPTRILDVVLLIEFSRS